MSKSAVYNFSYLHGAAEAYLKLADSTQGMHACTAILYSAFSLESVVNHIGEQVMPSWTEVSRRLGPKEKLLILGEFLGFRPDFSSSPYQAFTVAFSIRNRLAHSSTEYVPGRYDQGEDGLPKASWQELASLQAATSVVAGSRAIIEDLFERALVSSVPLFLLSERVRQ